MVTGLQPITRVRYQFPGMYDAEGYSIFGVPHGSAPVDESTAFLALLQIVYDAGGGTIVFNNRKYRFDSKVFIPNDSASPPRQPSIRIVGQGAFFSGQGGTPNGGTIIDLRFNGTPAKIDTRGLGLFEIGDLTLTDEGGANGTPFIQTTNTTLQIVGRLGIYGNTAAPSTTQDAIVLGGTVAGPADGTADSPFQGYGTIIQQCYFNRIRRGVYGRTYCNGVVIRDNTWWTQCGADANAAAVEFLADVSNSNSGNYIHGNLIEAPQYVYGMKFGGPFINNVVGPNSFFDPGAGFLANYRFAHDQAIFNLVVDGYRNDAQGSLVSESGLSVGKNTILTGHQSQVSTFAQPVTFRSGNVKQIIQNSPAFIVEDQAGNQFYQTHATGTFPAWQIDYLPFGGAAGSLLSVQQVSSTRKDMSMRGSSDNRFFAVSDLRVQAESGSTLFLGTRGVQDVILMTGNGSKINKGIGSDGTGVKHVRVGTGSIAASASADVTINFNGAAFADTSYTTQAVVEESTAMLQVVAVKSRTTTSCVVTVKNNDPSNALSGTVHVTAIHD